ncbi:DUF934 domain-containing protein [Panacagrimonas sp.]|uniref:DUF934 domain-containing protein n=1 Tax=Panacagrimonas sp. TaxID=2480088 RepID=UPI003B515AC4
MSALIIDSRQEQDSFVRLGDDEPVPHGARVLVSLAHWQAQAERISEAAAAVGVLLPNTADILDLAPRLRYLPLIVLEFPSFADGRAYSQARLLRDRVGFTGQLRATGAAVVRDQIAFLHRCGFNAFELRADQDLAACLRAAAELTPAYQPAQDTRPLVRRLRKGDVAHAS